MFRELELNVPGGSGRQYVFQTGPTQKVRLLEYLSATPMSAPGTITSVALPTCCKLEQSRHC